MHGGRACAPSYRQRMRRPARLVEWAPIVGGLAVAAIVMTWMSAYGAGPAPPVAVAAGVLAAVLLARGRRLLHGALTLLAMALVTWLWITLAGNL